MPKTKKAKEAHVRARCSKLLKDRINNYIAAKNESGHSLDEAAVVREALVWFLDAEEGRCPLCGSQSERPATTASSSSTEPDLALPVSEKVVSTSLGVSALPKSPLIDEPSGKASGPLKDGRRDQDDRR
jgi:hypothetical protein